MPTPETRLSTDARGVATISFQGIKSLNIVGTGEVELLTRAISSLAGREDLRLLVLTGAGEKAFIGGADIEEMTRLTPASAGAFITNLHRLCRAIRDLAVPVIARIRGIAWVAGWKWPPRATCASRVTMRVSACPKSRWACRP